jgi:inorganic pyrophosphatase
MDIEVYIEISKNSTIKYEYCHKRGGLICDRVLHTPFNYEFNYGFVPKTLSPDNDPLDVVVIMDHELVPGSYIKCKILGVLETEDDEGIDPKIIVCPSNKVDPTYTNINDITDIPKHQIEKIKYFFSHYKDLENKKVKVGNLLNKDTAIEIYQLSLQNYITNNK